jgi:hypothetical protein
MSDILFDSGIDYFFQPSSRHQLATLAIKYQHTVKDPL